MNEQLKKALDVIIAYIQQSGEFVKTQAPLVAQEYLKYNMVADIIWLTLDVVVLLIIVWSWFKYAKYIKKIGEITDDNDFIIMTWSIGNVAGCIPFVIGLFVTLMDLVKVLYAPRLYVLEGLKKLM
jgi:hypothetical protein